MTKKILNIDESSTRIIYSSDKMPEKLDDADVLAIREILIKNKNIKSLDLRNNNISCIGAEFLAKLEIEELFLSGNSIFYCEKEHDKYLQLIDALVKNKSMKKLYLDESYIPSNMISELIKQNDTIEDLQLPRSLTDKALEFIGKNSTLKSLFFPTNNLTDQACKYLSENTNLKNLIIYESNINDVGIQLLCQHRSLSYLEIRDSNISSECLKDVFNNSLIDKIKILSNKKNTISMLEASEFNYRFGDLIYEKKLKSQIEYYNYLQQSNGDELKHPDINPDYNNFDSLQDAINLIQYREAQYFDY